MDGDDGNLTLLQPRLTSPTTTPSHDLDATARRQKSLLPSFPYLVVVTAADESSTAAVVVLAVVVATYVMSLQLLLPPVCTLLAGSSSKRS